MKSTLKSTALWGMLFCALIAVSPAFPWVYHSSWELGAGFSLEQSVTRPTSAYSDWHGGVLSVIGGVGVLSLVATGSLRPVPIWRTIAVILVGAATITIILIYSTRSWRHFPVREYGALLAIFSATGLLLVACLEFRQYLGTQAKAQPPPDS